MKNKSDKASAINDIKKADIIIGTKMITTGFDFKNIGLI
jgi:primosomal protein N'